MAREHVSMEEFIRAWEAGENVAEVSAATGIKPQSCQVRAAAYRKRGIALKHMPRGGRRKLDVEAAKSFLASLRGQSVPAGTDTPDTADADSNRVPPGVGEPDTPNFG